MLTALSTRGRIVALPQALRTYRSSPESAARQMGRSVSPLDLWLIDMETKLTLHTRAVRGPGSTRERARLGATTLGNFSRKTFRNRFDHRTAMNMADDELTMLLVTARDRARLLQHLQGEIDARSKLLGERGEPPEPFTPAATEPLPPSTGPAVKPTRGRLRDFLRPASPAQIRWYAEVNYRITALRHHGERQLQDVNRSEAEAARLLSLL